MLRKRYRNRQEIGSKFTAKLNLLEMNNFKEGVLLPLCRWSNHEAESQSFSWLGFL